LLTDFHPPAQLGRRFDFRLGARLAIGSFAKGSADHADLPSAAKNPRKNLLTLELSEKQIALLPKLISVISQL